MEKFHFSLVIWSSTELPSFHLFPPHISMPLERNSFMLITLNWLWLPEKEGGMNREELEDCPELYFSNVCLSPKYLLFSDAKHCYTVDLSCLLCVCVCVRAQDSSKAWNAQRLVGSRTRPGEFSGWPGNSLENLVIFLPQCFRRRKDKTTN